MDEISGGAFSRGYRLPGDVDRVKRWDALTPEEMAQLRQKKGDEWVYRYGAEIERLRQSIPEIPVSEPA